MGPLITPKVVKAAFPICYSVRRTAAAKGLCVGPVAGRAWTGLPRGSMLHFPSALLAPHGTRFSQAPH